MQQYPRRKRTRLSGANYANPHEICSVTIAVKGRQPVFADAGVASDAISVLRSLAAARQVPIFAFCLMPDHVHLLLSPSEGCSGITFVGQFKNLVLRSSWKHGVAGSFWQQGFWDHFLRADKELPVAVEYILANPVRAGLVDDGRRYPYSGSLDFPGERRGTSPRPTG
jgi:REP element-mobilizing transposase RayT